MKSESPSHPTASHPRKRPTRLQAAMPHSAAKTDRTPSKPRCAIPPSSASPAGRKSPDARNPRGARGNPGSTMYAVHPCIPLLAKVGEQMSRLGISDQACRGCPVFGRPCPPMHAAIPPECRRCRGKDASRNPQPRRRREARQTKKQGSRRVSCAHSAPTATRRAIP